MEKLEELRAFIMRVRAMLLDHHLHHEAGGSDPVDLSAYVTKALFDANTILKADTDNTPVALAVAASRILGRAAAGGIAALTEAEVVTLLDLSAYVTKALFDANTILAANVNDTPLALAIAASRIVGRGAAGDIAALTGAQIMAILTGQNGTDFSMNTHKITGVVDPTTDQDAATKKYVDDNAPSLPRGRAFLPAPDELNFPNAKNAIVGITTTTAPGFDPDNMFQSGTWQGGVGDAGSNSTTIIDANPTTGAGFEASMLWERVIWDGGASYGFITAVNSATSVTIYMTFGTNFTVGDTYVINKHYFLIPTTGYWLCVGLTYWTWNSTVGGREYCTLVSKNGVSISQINQIATTSKTVAPLLSDIFYLTAGDKVALGVKSYAGVDTSDLIGQAAGIHTWLALSMLGT